MVAAAWTCPLQEADTFRRLDYKLRAVAKALKSWSARRIGGIRFQLAAARAIVLELDRAQEFRPLSDEERELRNELKGATLGLSSLARTVAL